MRSQFTEYKKNTFPIYGYMILGYNNGHYYHMYGDKTDNILFTDDNKENVIDSQIKAADCDFIIFANEKDAREDAANLKRYCHDEDWQLQMLICKCIIDVDTEYCEGNFLEYDAYKAGIVILKEILS